jgi:hypothetical protein
MSKTSVNLKAIELTRLSLELGNIPRICPVCKSSIAKLAIHHWNCPKDQAFRLGLYRRLCYNCNRVLGKIFSEGYPWSWEDQVKPLKEYLSISNRSYPHLEEPEDSWSRFSNQELKELELEFNKEYNFGPKPLDIPKDEIISLKKANPKLTLREIAHRFGVSRAYISQILLSNGITGEAGRAVRREEYLISFKGTFYEVRAKSVGEALKSVGLTIERNGKKLFQSGQIGPED